MKFRDVTKNNFNDTVKLDRRPFIKKINVLKLD